jgi:hypothetical protein
MLLESGGLQDSAAFFEWERFPPVMSPVQGKAGLRLHRFGRGAIAGGGAKRAEPDGSESIEFRSLVEREPSVETKPRTAANYGELREGIGTQSDAVFRRQVFTGVATTHAERPLAGRDIDDSLRHSALIR